MPKDTQKLDAEPLWWLIGVNHQKLTVSTLGFVRGVKTNASAEARTRAADESTFVNAFNIFDPGVKKEIKNWLISTGMTANDAPTAIVKLGKKLAEVLKLGIQ